MTATAASGTPVSIGSSRVAQYITAAVLIAAALAVTMWLLVPSPAQSSKAPSVVPTVSHSYNNQICAPAPRINYC